MRNAIWLQLTSLRPSRTKLAARDTLIAVSWIIFSEDQALIQFSVNPEGSCKRHICECDKQLAYGLREAEFSWNILHHNRWGGFDKDNCLAYRNGRSSRSEKLTEKVMKCCGKSIAEWPKSIGILGQNPNRFPYSEEDGYGNRKECCGNKTYNPFTFTCCDDTVMEIGSC